jgi:hypothetical protein
VVPGRLGGRRRRARAQPFDEEEALALARQRGLDDEETALRLLDWSEGSPLALALGAEAARDGGWEPALLEGRPDLVRAILRRLADEELLEGDGDVLAVAAIARVVTARLLREVLPGVDADEAQSWLRGRTFAEHVGEGVALHDLVRKAMHADLKARRPEHERELRRRIADHLHARAARGDLRLLPDLADLVENPALRWGMGAEGSVRYRLDGVRPDDLPGLVQRLRARIETTDAGWAAYWEPTARLLLETPDRALAVRDPEERLCGVAYAVTPDNAPAPAEQDRLLGPWLAHAREHAPGGQALLWRDSIDLTTSREGDVASPILALMNTGVVLRSGLRNPRWSYMPIDPENAAAVQFARSVRARHVEELDVAYDAESRRTMQCWILDSGEDGMLGGMLATVYAELGLPRPKPEIDEPAGGEPPPQVTADDIRDALRTLDQPTELAASPLARGTTPEERAAFVRTTLERAVEQAFGEGPEEELLRQVLRRGYLEASSSHEAAWWELHLSRATYFRKLRTASARVAEWLMAERSRG